MADKTKTTEVVEVTQTTEMTPGIAPTAEPALEAAPAVEPAIDWDAAPAYEETAVEQTTVSTMVATTDATTYSEQSDVTTYNAPRSRWDFSESQRIVVGVLLWLNILVLVTGYLAVTGQLTI